MNKCFCFSAALIVYLILSINVTMIIISWIKPELLNPNWWRGKFPTDFPATTTVNPNICLDEGDNNKTKYQVYWNMPSIACSRYGLTFTYVMSEYGITMNEGDSFRGDKISILYNPGLFPKIRNYTDETTSLDDLVLVNGGIPQDGNIMEHLEAFEEQVNKQIPDPKNEGLIIIDMEQFGITWKQNFGEMLANHRLSIKRVQDEHPEWTIQEVTTKAKKDYDIAAKRFILTTIRYGKAIRPKGKWGYYQYPQCFNRPRDTPDSLVPCSNSLRKENDRIIWLYHASDILYPSTYLGINGTVLGKAGVIRGRVQEAIRAENCTGRNLPSIPYASFKYFKMDGMILDEDLEILLKVPKEEGSPGVVMWGGYSDFSNAERCLIFSNWLNTSFGPIAKRVINS